MISTSKIAFGGKRLAGIIACVSVVGATMPIAFAADVPRATISFQRDVRPILSDACFDCHGPDAKARKGRLRLDVSDGGIFEVRDGGRIVSAGKPDDSELIRRITSTDPDERMPPPKHHRQLKTAEINILSRWVAAGAKWQDHWSLIAPGRPPLPSVRQFSWPRNGIDSFVLARLEKEGLSPAPEADRPTLIRRVTLDLTGLPPTPGEVDAFLADSAPDAYMHLVDRLLQSPRYGERMAVDWLDAARYADTNGFQVDRDREMWPWRDWVVKALNRNQPFDQFTIEQIAGDLLPKPTLEQRVATGMHRNSMMNEEGGIIADEFLAESVADRVETTSTIWLGLTVGCARCHDHKYDPLSHKDYYRLAAFFNSTLETGMGNFGAEYRQSAPPLLSLATPAQQERLDRIAAEIATTEKQLAAAKPAGATEQATKHLKQQRARLKHARAELEKRVPTMMVMGERSTPRDTYLLVRGQYDKKGEKVAPGTPASLPPLSAAAPRNRLGLAGWLVDARNPLTARVTVNRFWQSYFGAGLVRTAEDFGSQGEAPSHPELLDWLATEFINSGWDIKKVQRSIVTSATYRQSSQMKPGIRERDPENRLLSRGPRGRLLVEIIRDQALAVSGLLAETLGGPAVKPYHPAGLYEQVVTTGANSYQQGHGADLYRRSLYTYRKRSVPHPALLTFDAPFRETCVARRAITSTPLQSLNLMNDPTYVEAARFLAQRMLLEAGASPEDRIVYGFRLVVARRPTSRELDVLFAGYKQMLDDFRQDRAAADELLRVGESPANPALDRAELAAYSTIASTLLNLDETISKE